MYLGNGNPDTFANNLTLENSGSSYIILAYNSVGNFIGGNLTATNSGNGNTYIEIGYNNASTVSISGNVTMNNSGFGSQSRNYLCVRGTVNISGDLIINNNASATNARMYVAYYNGSQVTVNGNTTILNNGNAANDQIYIGNQGDITFNGTVSITNNSSAGNSRIYFNYDANSNVNFNENITVESTDASSDGISFGENGGNATLAAGKTITIGAGGFIAGDLEFRNFTQTGNTAQNLTCTGTARIYNYDSNWGGDVHFVAPRIVTRGTTYNGTAYLEKTGATDDVSAGGNDFKQDVELKNSGSRYFLMGNNHPDTCRANLTINNTGSHYMYFAHHSIGNYVAGNMTINNVGTSGNNYVYISYYSASSLDVAGNCTINNSGTSSVCRIYMPYDGDMTIGGDLSVTNSTTDVASVTLAQNSNSSLVVNGNTNITNNNGGTTKQLYLGVYGDITFNGTLTIHNFSSASNSQVYLNYDDNSSNSYNDDIILEVTDANCDGIFFGYSNGNGTLATGKTISIGPNGYVAGYLRFRNFTQLGNTAQTLHPTGTSYLYIHDSQWNGNVDFIAPRIYLRGSTYNGTAYIEKTGNTNDDSYGGNIYNANAIIVNNSSAILRLARYVANDYNADVYYEKTGSGALYPTINGASTFAGDININSNADITFAAWTNGRVIMDGTTAQSINNTGAAHTFVFRNFRTDNPNDEITLNTPIEISGNLDLLNGNIITTSTNLLYMRDNSTVTSVSDDAYVDGPVEKIGNDAFTFPVGNGGYYAPISISAPSSTAHRFRAQYYYQDPDNAGDTTALDVTLHHISHVEYWTLDRTNGTSTVDVTLSWDTRSSGVTNLADLAVAHWNGSIWQDYGNDATTGDVNSGTITVNSVTSFSPFTLASKTSENPLPVKLITFTGELNGSQVDLFWETASEINNYYFTVERSKGTVNFEPIGIIDGKGNYNGLSKYFLTDYNPLTGISYYRLKQTDFDGRYTYSDIISIHHDPNNINLNKSFELFPNPASNSSDVKMNLTGFSGEEKVLVVVKNVLGQQLYSKVVLTDINGNNIEALDPNDQLSSGTYIIVASSDDTLLSKRLIIK